MDARRAWSGAIAFLVGLALGAALLYAGSGGGPSLGGSAPVLVRVTNSGTHAADVTLGAAEALGANVGQAQARVAPGATETFSFGEHDESIVVTASVRWEDLQTTRTGENRAVGDPSDCGRSEDAVFEFVVDTTRGVSFTRAAFACR